MNIWEKIKIASFHLREAWQTLFGKSTSAKIAPVEFVGYEGRQKDTDPPPRTSSCGANSYQGVPPNIDAEAAALLNLAHIRSTSGIKFEQMKEQGAVMGFDSITIATPQ